MTAVNGGCLTGAKVPESNGFVSDNIKTFAQLHSARDPGKLREGRTLFSGIH